MRISDFFRPVPAMTVEEVRRYLTGHPPDAFNLIDVRQPKEYEAGHLPGARLIPLGQLRDHLASLEADRPTFVY